MHMNNSSCTFIETENIPYPLSTLTAFTCALIINFATLGNFGLILLISSSDKLFNNTGIFIISMAIADLGVGIISSPIFLACALQQEWKFGAVLCNTNGFFNLLLCEVSLLSLAGVSLDRYWAICRTMEYHLVVTHRRTVRLVFAIWFICVLFASLPLFGISTYKVTPPQFGCIADWEENIAFSVSVFAVCGASPFAIIFYVYFKIFKVARSHIREINVRDVRDCSPKKERKTLITIVAIVGVFLICWGPYFVVTGLNVFLPKGHIPDSAVTSTAFMAFSNSAIQPYIYGITNSEYRLIFFRKLRRFFAKYCGHDNYFMGSIAEQTRVPISRVHHDG